MDGTTGRGWPVRWAAMTMAMAIAVAGACSGDGDDGSNGGGAAAVGREPVDPYEGHTSATYEGTDNWICHPDLPTDPCRDDLAATEIAPDGTRTPTSLAPEPEADGPPIDCLYLYPSVSTDPGTNSDLVPGDAERLAVRTEAGPFTPACRMYVPSHRQVTGAAIAGADQRSLDVAYRDVVDAWRTYVSRYNDGRGVVLLGHSQGAIHLTRLVAEEVDRSPELRARLVSAILLGWSVLAPDGEDVGGTFAHVPACRGPGQVGCVVTYSSYPADTPPVADDGPDFGRAGADGRALCVDPTTLVEDGDGAGRTDAVFPVEAPLLGPLDLGAPVGTPFVAVPDALEVSCRRDGDYDYLAVTRPPADDPRPFAGLLTAPFGGYIGLHVQDAYLAMTTLVAAVDAQSRAYGE